MHPNFFRIFFSFWTLFPIAAFVSFHYVMQNFVCSKFRFDSCLGHQITLNQIYVIDCEAHSIVVGFVFVKNHSVQIPSVWGICSPDVFFNSYLKPIRANGRLVTLAVAVFWISSSGAKRYMSGLWSFCRVSCYIYNRMSFLRKKPAMDFFRGVSINCCFFL